ncbi:MAG: DUF2079 domain-containing protein [Firmicutes bacterium]|nr:DUF2079 domain-containing protein [Bacillota bacterium]
MNEAKDKTGFFTPSRTMKLAIVLFFLIFTYFAGMRYYSGYRGDPDYSTFEQCIYTSAYEKMLQYNTFESRSHFRFRNPDMPKEELLKKLETMDGASHFAVHNSGIFFLVIPFYWIYPDLITLIIIQTLCLAMAGWAVFLIGKELISEKAGLLFGILYLIYFPMHGVAYDSFHEFGFVVPFVLFAFYYMLKRRFLPFWTFVILAIICKEDIPFLISAFGMFMVYSAWKEKKDGKWDKAVIKNPLAVHGLVMVALGVLWLYLSLFVIIPQVRGVEYHFFGERYKDLGNTFSEAVVTIFTKPQVVFKNLFQYPKFTFFMEMVAPLAFMSFFCFPAFLVACPNLLINTLSSFSVMYNTGSRYCAPIIPFVFISAMLGFTAILAKAKTEEEKAKKFSKMMKIAFFISIAGTLFFNPSPFRIGWKVPKITEHRKISWKVINEIPKKASLATQVDLFLYTCRGSNKYVGYRQGVEYLLVDAGPGSTYTVEPSTGELTIAYGKDKNKWLSEGADWDITLPQLVKSGEYQLIKQEDGVGLFRKKG